MPKKKTSEPKLVGTATKIPPVRRNAKWQLWLETKFKPNPGVVYVFTGCGKSTATDLRRTYGLNATMRRGRLYVSWDPEKADEILASYSRNRDPDGEWKGWDE